MDHFQFVVSLQKWLVQNIFDLSELNTFNIEKPQYPLVHVIGGSLEITLTVP